MTLTTFEKLELILIWAEKNSWAKKNFDNKTMEGISEDEGTTDYIWPTPN